MKAILLNRVLVVLGFLGLFVAGVLSLEAGLNLMVPCGGSNSCQVVAQSSESHILGIPIAYFGVVGYLLLAALAVYRSTLPVVRWSRSVTFGYLMGAVGSAASLWLQYESIYVIRATCIWCMSSALIMLVSLVLYAVLASEVDRVIEQTPVTVLDEPDASSEGSPSPVAVPAGSAATSDFRLPLILAVLVILGVSILGFTMKHGELVGTKPAPANTDPKILIPVGAHTLGVATSPLTIVEFADLCCPTCQRISPQVKQYVFDHPGKVRLVFREFPIPQLHPQAMTAAAIAEAAADEGPNNGRFFEYVMAVMSLGRQPKDADELFQIAKAVGLDDMKIRNRLANNDDPVYNRLDRDMQSVHALGIVATPTFYTFYNGKAQEMVSANSIMDTLKTEKYQRLMNGGKP